MDFKEYLNETDNIVEVSEMDSIRNLGADVLQGTKILRTEYLKQEEGLDHEYDRYKKILLKNVTTLQKLLK